MAGRLANGAGDTDLVMLLDLDRALGTPSVPAARSVDTGGAAGIASSNSGSP